MESMRFESYIYNCLTEIEKFRLYEKQHLYQELFIKNKIKNNYSKMKYLIAKQKMLDFGFKENEVIEFVYENNEIKYYNYAQKFWPDNMLQQIDNEDVFSKISIKICCLKELEYVTVYISYNHFYTFLDGKRKFNNGEDLFCEKYELNSDIFYEEIDGITKWVMPKDFKLQLKSMTESHDLKGIDWDEKIKNAKTIFIK